MQQKKKKKEKSAGNGQTPKDPRPSFPALNASTRLCLFHLSSSPRAASFLSGISCSSLFLLLLLLLFFIHGFSTFPRNARLFEIMLTLRCTDFFHPSAEIRSVHLRLTHTYCTSLYASRSTLARRYLCSIPIKSCLSFALRVFQGISFCLLGIQDSVLWRKNCEASRRVGNPAQCLIGRELTRIGRNWYGFKSLHGVVSIQISVYSPFPIL